VTAISAIFFNTFVNPIALEAIAWKYYIVFVVVLVTMCFTAYFIYPETRGHSLEQMTFIFDREDANAPQPAETKERAASMSVDAGTVMIGKDRTMSVVTHQEKV
jgi:hypothetical protein